MEHTLLLARHGQTNWNLERRLQGASDVPLNATGHLQAVELASSLSREELDLACVSDLKRSQETFEAFHRLRPEVPMRVETRLREVNLGKWEGVLEADLLEDPAHQFWRDDPLHAVAPGGEGVMDVARRVAPLLDEFAEFSRPTTVVIFGHQYTNAVLYCLISGVPLHLFREHFTTPGSVRRATIPGRK